MTNIWPKALGILFLFLAVSVEGLITQRGETSSSVMELRHLKSCFLQPWAVGSF